MTIEKLAELVDRGFRGLEAEIRQGFRDVDARFEDVEHRLEALEAKESEHFHFIMDTLSGFMKRMTDQEDEFVLIKNEANVVKGALKKKLAIDIDSPEFR